MTERLRVIFDYSIFWRALFYPAGSGNDCISLIKDGKILHFMSKEILHEVTDVLTRRETFEKFPSVGIVEADALIQSVVSRSLVISNVPRAFRLPRDPKDEPYIDLAAATEADYLVTTDRDLLDLMTGIDLVSKQFRQRFRGLKVVEPKEFLQIISKSDMALRP